MKTLQDIVEKHHTKIFKKYFAFFAFGSKPLEQYENHNVNFNYCSLGIGLCAPIVFRDVIFNKIEAVQKKAIKLHKSLESKKAIMWYAFGNYETQLTDDLTNAKESLIGYGYTNEEMENEYKSFYKDCLENNYF